jgi:hypothetical protein
LEIANRRVSGIGWARGPAPAAGFTTDANRVAVLPGRELAGELAVITEHGVARGFEIRQSEAIPAALPVRTPVGARLCVALVATNDLAINVDMGSTAPS